MLCPLCSTPATWQGSKEGILLSGALTCCACCACCSCCAVRRPRGGAEGGRQAGGIRVHRGCQDHCGAGGAFGLWLLGSGCRLWPSCVSPLCMLLWVACAAASSPNNPAFTLLAHLLAACLLQTLQSIKESEDFREGEREGLGAVEAAKRGVIQVRGWLPQLCWPCAIAADGGGRARRGPGAGLGVPSAARPLFCWLPKR